jgi:uncharacterized protein YdhG (YjbR/CyaY superfamily)
MTDVATFLAKVPEWQRASLEELRATIRAAAPEAVELINYGVPMFRLAGKNLVAFAAAKNHCSFYVQSPAVMEAHAEELRAYDTTKGTIRFTPDKPLPGELVQKLVLARIAENAGA